MLCLDALDLVSDLSAAFFKLLDLLIYRVLTCLEQTSLAFDQFGDVGAFTGHLQQDRIKPDLVGTIALCFKAPTPGHQFEQLPFGDQEFAAQQAGVQLDQRLPFNDGIALVHQNFRDHAAVQMLNDLAIAVHFQPARGDDCTGNRCLHRPGAEAAHENQQPQKTQNYRTARRPCLVRTHRTPPMAAVLDSSS